MVPVVPGGRSIPLNFHNRMDYVDSVTRFKLHEMDRQVRGPVVNKMGLQSCVIVDIQISLVFVV